VEDFLTGKTDKTNLIPFSGRYLFDDSNIWESLILFVSSPLVLGVQVQRVLQFAASWTSFHFVLISDDKC